MSVRAGRRPGPHGVLTGAGRKGNPNSDDDWFVTDWMDTARAQEALAFQHYSWQDMLDGDERADGPEAAICLRLVAPLARVLLKLAGPLPEAAGPVRRSVGCHCGQTGRSLPGQAADRKLAGPQLVFAGLRVVKYHPPAAWVPPSTWIV